MIKFKNLVIKTIVLLMTIFFEVLFMTINVLLLMIYIFVLVTLLKTI